MRQAIPFLDREKGRLPRGELLALRPVRSREITWEMTEAEAAGGAKLTVPRREDRVGQLLSWVFRIPQSRVIELDEFGAQVWAQCDGQHSVEQLIRFTCETYKLNRRQGEVSVVTFMKMLVQRRLLGFPQGQSAGTQTEGKGTGNVHHRKQRPQTKKRRRH